MADVVAEAQRLYQESLDTSRQQRQQIEEDLRFSDPSDPDQWDPDVRRLRETDPGGKRPCLVMDQTGQYVANVAGQVEKQPPAIHAIPVGGGADKRAAEQIDGRFRHIEYASRASQHYTRVLTSAARAGVGYLIVRPEYIDRALGWQEPRISSEPDPLKVVFDPWSQDTDGADATFGFLLSAVSPREFERRWKGQEPRSFGDVSATRRTDERQSIVVAEQWEKAYESRNVVLFVDAQGAEQSMPEDDYWAHVQAHGEVTVTGTYTDKQACVRWRLMSGAAVLEQPKQRDGKPGAYPCEHIGLVPVYGYLGWRDGRLTYCGIPRRARSPQQAYNYHMSEQLAYIGSAPRAPWLISHRALAGKGVQALWDRASVEQRAYLPWTDLDNEGPVTPPTRSAPSVNLANHIQGAEQAKTDIQAAIGMYQANLGAPSNESSGVAIESRKQQGEASTAHFPSHMAASLGQVGRIVMQMDARLSDTKRKQTLIGIDGSAGSVVVDPDQAEAFARGPEGVAINPRIGAYGVRVVVGASYSTQRSQTNAAFTEIMRGNPEMAPTVAPFWAQTLDFPGADKFAQALAAMAPEPVKAILQPEGEDGGPDVAELMAQVDQLKNALQEAIQHAQEAQGEADQANADLMKREAEQAERDRELDIAAYNAETARLKVTGANVDQIEAITRDLINQMLLQPDPLPGDPQAAETPVPGDAPGADDTEMHEQAEAPQIEQTEQINEAPAEPGMEPLQ